MQMVKEVFAGSSDVLNMQVKPLAVDLAPPYLHTQPKTPTSSRRFVENVLCMDFGSVPEMLRQEAKRAGLVPSEPWIGKVEQLFVMTQLKHGVCVCMRACVRVYACMCAHMCGYRSMY